MSDNVELVIGARNEAKAVLEELGSQLRDLAVPAQQSSMKAQAAISGLIARLAYASAAVAGAAATAAVAIGATVTASAVKAIKDEADALDSLTKKIQNYVADSKISIESHKEFADSLNKSIGVSEKDTLLLIDKAIALGVTEERLQDAALGAIGLAKSLDIDLNSALVKVINGDTALVSITDSVNRGLNAQATEVAGVAGVWATLEFIAKSAIEFMSESLDPLRQDVLELSQSIGDGFIAALIGARTAVEVLFENLVFNFTGLQSAWQYTTTVITNDAVHVFTVAIPAYVGWFSENTRNLFNDTLNAIAAVFQNWSKTVGQSVLALWNFVASGGEGGMEKLTNAMLAATSSLMDGFVATATEFPEVLKRQIGKDEADLANAMGALGASMSDSFAARFKANMDALKVTIPQVNNATLSGLKPGEVQAVKTGGNGIKEIQAVESRLLTRGRSDNTMDKIAASTKASADRLASIDESLKKTEDVAKSIQLEVVA